MAEILKKNGIRMNLNKKSSIEEVAFQLQKICLWQGLRRAFQGHPPGAAWPLKAMLEGIFPKWKPEKVIEFFDKINIQKTKFSKFWLKTKNAIEALKFRDLTKILKILFFEY